MIIAAPEEALLATSGRNVFDFINGNFISLYKFREVQLQFAIDCIVLRVFYYLYPAMTGCNRLQFIFLFRIKKYIQIFHEIVFLDMPAKSPSLLLHIRDWLALPFVVTVIIPFLLYRIGAHIMQAPPDVFKIGGLLVYALGLSMQLYTTSLFWKYAQGTLAPWQPTQKLVIRGPYRYCRNPMITGVLFMLLGEALFFNAFAILIWTCIFFAMNTMYFIFK